MLNHPVLKYSFHAEFIDDDKILLSSETDSVLLTGKTYALILSTIQKDEFHTDELVKSLDGRLSEFEIYWALDVLESQGYISEASADIPIETLAFWNSQGIDMNILVETLRKKTVTVKTIGSVDPGYFHEALGAMGARINETNDTGVLKIFVTDDYRREEFREINRDALRTGQPWIPVKPVGVELWIGPVFIPGKTGCWECMEQRLHLNRPMDAFYKTQKNTGDNLPVPLAHIPLSLQVGANLAALEIVKWIYFGENERIEGKLITFDTRTIASRSHALVKRPQCEICGDPGHKGFDAHPITLERKSTAIASASGGYRECLPEETLEKYRRHVSPVTGVVKYLKPYHTIKGAPVYNYASGPNTALQSKTLYWLNSHIRSANGGKGRTWAQAEVGALCEAIERYSMTYRGEEPYITANLLKLGDDGVHPNACMNFSESQYREREIINRACSKFYSLVPAPFDESLNMRWTPLYSLTRQRFKYLPSCLCYGQVPADDESKLFAYPDSNGAAAGNSLEEAILQGFLELVERDSVALWWYNRLRKPAVDLSSFDDPYFFQLIEYYKTLGRSLCVLDITADLKIPAFTAVSHRIGGGKEKKENILFGFGAHIDVRIAVERALIELNQLLPIAEAPGTDPTKGKYLTEDKTFIDWLNTATMDTQSYLAPVETAPFKKAADYTFLCKPTIYDSLMYCVETASEHGLETLVLDLTRKDVGLPAVKVVVPGLRHFWKRLAPGRLYNVPVKMGWLDSPLNEDEMNPTGIFI